MVEITTGLGVCTPEGKPNEIETTVDESSVKIWMGLDDTAMSHNRVTPCVQAGRTCLGCCGDHHGVWGLSSRREAERDRDDRR